MSAGEGRGAGAPVDANPFVGPRAIKYREPIYGRDREIEEVTNTLVSQRIVLLYSPSGAGKSSMLEAGVRPRLESRDFHVLPTVRLSHPLDAGAGNRYLTSTKLSLCEALPAGEQWDPQRLADVPLEQLLDEVLAVTATPEDDPCLLFDQFEELFTLDPVDWDDKRAFLTELGVALRERSRWALFAMREDYIAQLDPLLALIPTRLATRYRLDLLEPDAARVAITKTAAGAGVEFEQAAADHLIDDLRRTRVSRGGETVTVPGRYVEPVVLQAVCRRLWEQSGGQARIVQADVEALGDVDDALADFCDDRFERAAAESGVSEQVIRDWVERELITEQGFRSQAVSGPTEAGPAVLRALQDGHLLRAESRRGTTWYEIPHDRLVPPIRASNRRWLDDHLDPVQSAASRWAEHDRSVDLLLRGAVLANAEQWVDEHPAEARPIDREFVDACRAEWQRIENERLRERRDRLRVMRIAATVAIAALVVGTAVSVYFVLEERATNKELTDALQEAEASLNAAATLALENADVADDVIDDVNEEAALAAEAMKAAEQALSDAAAAGEDTTLLEEEVDRLTEEAAEAAAVVAAVETAVAQASDMEPIETPLAISSALTVQRGDEGDAVGWLQQELRALDAVLDPDDRFLISELDFVPDCRFGPITEANVERFQRHRGLAQTGVADDDVWTAIGVDVERVGDSPEPLFVCAHLEAYEDPETCSTAVPVEGLPLVARALPAPTSDADLGPPFLEAPGSRSLVNYHLADGLGFVATGRCSSAESTDWWEVRGVNDVAGYVDSQFLFIDHDRLDARRWFRVAG